MNKNEPTGGLIQRLADKMSLPLGALQGNGAALMKMAAQKTNPNVPAVKINIYHLKYERRDARNRDIFTFLFYLVCSCTIIITTNGLNAGSAFSLFF